MKNLLIKLSNALCTVIILFAVFVLLNVVMTRSGEAPQIFGYSMFRVMSGSMEPTLPVDSMVLVKHTEASEVAVDDVISFYSQDPQLDGMVNTHRVIEVNRENEKYSFVTKGDANYIADTVPVSEADLIGKVVFTSLFLGRMVRLMANPLVFLPLILIPLAIILILNILSAVRSVKALMKQEEEEAYRKAVEELKNRRENEKK